MSKKIIIILICILATCGLFHVAYVKADSGWDSSYDSGSYGGSYSSGSYGGGYSSSSNYPYSSSNSSGINFSSPLAAICAAILFIVLAIAIITSYIIKTIANLKNRAQEKQEVTNINNKILEIIPNFNIDTISKEAFSTYEKFLNLWINNDTKEIEKISSNKFFNIICQALEKRKNTHEVIKDISLIDYKLVKTIINDDNSINLIIGFKFKCINYVIDNNSKNILLGNKKECSYEYVELEFNIDKKEKILIVNKIIGLPYFSNNFFDKN